VDDGQPGDIIANREGANVAHENNSEVALRLVDGGGTIELLRDGTIKGLDTPYAEKVREVLVGGNISVDPVVRELRSASGVLMGGNDSYPSFRLMAPVGKIILEDRPGFRWNGIKGAESYKVNIFDANFRLLRSSGELKTTNWRLGSGLKRGSIYQWQVTANVGGEQIKFPVRPAPEAKFKIVDAARAAELARLKATKSNQHLLLGTLYAQAGLLDDAEKEFRVLLKMNPRSELVQKLLKKVRAAR
jgi:hypothetical protein